MKAFFNVFMAVVRNLNFHWENGCITYILQGVQASCVCTYTVYIMVVFN